MASEENQEDLGQVTRSLTVRPQALDISPSASRQNSRCVMDGDSTDETSLETYDEDTELTQLLREYAENDSSYEGYAVATPNDNNDDDDDIAKDGPVLSKKKEICNISVGSSPQQLQLISNGKLKEKMVSTPVKSGIDTKFMHLFHHSGPSNRESVIKLQEGQSPQLEPVYDEDKLDGGTKIQFSIQPSPPLPTPPGSDTVKMVSETKLLLALDYSDQLHPKLITVPYSEMKKKLIAIKKGEAIKMKPIINVRYFPTKHVFDNTALYFRVDQFYYFLYVDESKLHLELKIVEVQLGQTPNYIMYTYFQPTVIDSGASLLKRKGSDHMDGQLEAEEMDTETAGKEATSPPIGETAAVPTISNSSVLQLKKTSSDSTANDSGIDTRSPDSNEEGKIIPKK